METEPSEEPDNTYQRALFNYKLKWDNNDLDWLDVANKIFEAEVELVSEGGD